MMTMTQTFKDVNDRERSMETPEGKYLMGRLPSDIAVRFRDAFLITGETGGQVEKLTDYFLRHSTIGRIVSADSSSAETFEYLYRKRPVDSEIDEYFVRAKAAIGIYERLVALKKHLPEIIREGIANSNLD